MCSRDRPWFDASRQRNTSRATKPRKDAGATGPKGRAIIAANKEHPDWTRKQIAEAVGCCVARVGEALRATGREASQPGRRRPIGKDTPKPVARRQKPQRSPLVETRTGRCEHEIRRKARRGTCKVCPPLVVPAV